MRQLPGARLTPVIPVSPPRITGLQDSDAALNHYSGSVEIRRVGIGTVRDAVRVIDEQLCSRQTIARDYSVRLFGERTAHSPVPAYPLYQR